MHGFNGNPARLRGAAHEAVGLGRSRDRPGRKGTSQRMGFIDLGMGRALAGAPAKSYRRQAPPDTSDSSLSHSQAMILGGVARHFLLFGGAKGRAKRAAMFVRSVPLVSAVVAPTPLYAVPAREER